MTKNPFTPVTIEKAPLLKILFYGNPGTGKSRAAYTFPSPAVVDAENKSTLHAGVQGISQFASFPARSLDELDTAIAYIEEDKGKTYKTLVVDSITVLYLRELERVRMTGDKKVLGVKQRADVNRRMDDTYARLAHLPVHIVVIAREATEYDDSMKAVGIKPDSGGDLGYTFDMVIHMQKDYSGIVERETGQLLTKNNRLVMVNWGVFEDALRNRNKPWYDKSEKITVILERAKKYFAPISTHNRIREVLFELLKIKQWSDLGDDESTALQRIADVLNKTPDESPFPDASGMGLGDGVGIDAEGTSVATSKQKAEATNV